MYPMEPSLLSTDFTGSLFLKDPIPEYLKVTTIVVQPCGAGRISRSRIPLKSMLHSLYSNHSRTFTFDTASLERLFRAVLRGCLQFVIVVFPDHTHLLFLFTWASVVE